MSKAIHELRGAEKGNSRNPHNSPEKHITAVGGVRAKEKAWQQAEGLTQSSCRKVKNRQISGGYLKAGRGRILGTVILEVNKILEKLRVY